MIGYTILRFIVVFAAAISMAWIFVGPINITTTSIIFGLITITIGYTIVFLLMAFMGLFAFWLEESYALFFIYDKMRFILGGFLFPLEILPLWLATPARKLPFAAALYYPAKIFVNFSWKTLIEALKLQITWIIILTILVSIIYKKGIKKVSIHGG